MTKDAEPQVNTDVISNNGANVDQIREIIFGGQMRDYEKRFAKFEETLLKEVSNIRNEIGMRIDSLESFFKGEIDALNDTINNEKSLRDSGDKRLNKHLDELGQHVEVTNSELKEQANKGLREVRQNLLEQGKQMSSNLAQARHELSDAIERAQCELGDEKTDRAALASMFTEMAMRLNNEFELPSGEK